MLGQKIDGRCGQDSVAAQSATNSQQSSLFLHKLFCPHLVLQNSATFLNQGKFNIDTYLSLTLKSKSIHRNRLHVMWQVLTHRAELDYERSDVIHARQQLLSARHNDIAKERTEDQQVSSQSLFQPDFYHGFSRNPFTVDNKMRSYHSNERFIWMFCCARAQE